MIHVRLPPGAPTDWLDDLRRSVSGEHESATVTIYRRLGLSADLGIHILVDDDEPEVDDPEARSTPLGLRLASELRKYGLVEHSIWKEEDIPNDVDNGG